MLSELQRYRAMNVDDGVEAIGELQPCNESVAGICRVSCSHIE